MIIDRFYDATHTELYDILRVYGKEHGQSSKVYARKTYPKWQSGETKLSGQTKDRLVRCVPECLSADERYDIAKQICMYYETKRLKKSAHININTEEPILGLNILHNTIKDFYESRDIIELPKELTHAISWLAKDDITAARALLARVEQESADRIENKAYRELEMIEYLLAKEEVAQINQTIEFPNGCISLSTFTPQKPFFKRLMISIFGS